jgi:hypothetical protein
VVGGYKPEGAALRQRIVPANRVPRVESQQPASRITANSPAEAPNAGEAICAGRPLQRRSGPGGYLPSGGSCYTPWRFCYTALRGNRRAPEASKWGLRRRTRALVGPEGAPARVFRAARECEYWPRPSGSVPSSRYVFAVWARIGFRIGGSRMLFSCFAAWVHEVGLWVKLREVRRFIFVFGMRKKGCGKSG